jgi:hypothetical protein
VRSIKKRVSRGLVAVSLDSALDGGVFSYTPWPLYSLRERLRYALFRRQVLAQGWSGILSGRGISVHVGNRNTTLLTSGPWQLASYECSITHPEVFRQLKSSSVAVKHYKFIIQMYTYLRGYMFRLRARLHVSTESKATCFDWEQGYMFRLRAVIFRPFNYIQNHLIKIFKMHMGSQYLQW